MKPTIAAAAVAVFSILAARAQTPASAPEFEVASVKPAVNPPFGGRAMPVAVSEMFGFRGGPGTKDPGRLTCTAVSLKALLVRAYKVKSFQIVGPGWLDTTLFDITAKIPPGTTDDQFRLMLQKLLTERFRVELHRESKELPQYRLTVARGGPKLSPPDTVPNYKDEAEQMAAVQKQLAAHMQAMSRAPAMGQHRSMGMASGTVAKFAETLSGYLDHPVTDMTGVDGLYSFSLSWVPDNEPVPDDSSGPSLAQALQEQLGLKLEMAKGPVEMLVIDKAEKVPIEN